MAVGCEMRECQCRGVEQRLAGVFGVPEIALSRQAMAEISNSPRYGSGHIVAARAHGKPEAIAYGLAVIDLRVQTSRRRAAYEGVTERLNAFGTIAAASFEDLHDKHIRIVPSQQSLKAIDDA